MEQLPQDNEMQRPQRPMLSLDLDSEQGNVFAVIGHALEVVPPEEQEQFKQEIQAVTALGAGSTYENVLALVDMYVELIDISETHLVYGNPAHVRDATERYQRYVMSAVERLNDQMVTLPETTPVQIDGMYPEFNDPDYAPEAYMVVLNVEIGRVEADIDQSSVEEREALELYRGMLRECRDALRQAGVI
jgi:hypothetical protein